MVDHGGRHSSRQSIQKMLYGVGPFILSRQNGGFVCIQDKRFGMRNLPASAVKAGDGSTIVPTVNPFVGDVKFGFGKVRSLFFLLFVLTFA